MPREVISTPEAPEYPSYSQAVKVGNTIYVAGTIGVDVATGELAGHTIQEQTRQSLRNCQAILRAGGAELSDAVMVHTLLLRPEDADGVMEGLRRVLPRRAAAALREQAGSRPARDPGVDCHGSRHRLSHWAER